MNEQQYQSVLNWCRTNKTKEKLLTLLCRYSPISVIIIYLGTISYLVFQHDSRLIKVLLYPFLALLTITLMRKLYNCPRPADMYSIHPLIKHHQGESFPSRHTGSAVIIAFSCLYISYPLGLLCFIIAMYVGVSRVIAGVHFIKDVVAGAVISTILGILMFIL